MPLSTTLWTLPIGCLFGLAIYPPVARWLGLFRRLLLTRQGRSDITSTRQKLLLGAIALLGHPAPWLLLVAVPYAVWRLWNEPTGPLWLWFAAGALAGCAIMWAWARRTRSAPASGAG